MKSTWLRDMTDSESDPDIFKNVCNEDTYLEAKIRKEYKSEKERLWREKDEIERKIKDFETNIKTEKARRKFVDKKDFLFMEAVEERKAFLTDLINLLKGNDVQELENRIWKEKGRIYNSAKYVSFGKQELDVLYDYNKANLYKKIKQNVESEGFDKEFGEIEIKRDNWVLVRDSERKSKPSDD